MVKQGSASSFGAASRGHGSLVTGFDWDPIPFATDGLLFGFSSMEPPTSPLQTSASDLSKAEKISKATRTFGFPNGTWNP